MHFRKSQWINSLGLKILLSYVAGATLSIALLILAGALIQDRLPGMDLSSQAHELARTLTFDADNRPVGFTSSPTHPAWIYDSLRDEIAYRVLDENRAIVLESPGTHYWPDTSSLSEFEFTHHGQLYDGATVALMHAGQSWYVQFAVSSRIVDFLHLEFAVPFIERGIIAFSLVLLFVFGLCTYISLKYSLKPLRRASLAAAAISPRALGTRLQTTRVPAEIVPLLNSFNRALDRLENGYRLQQDFLAQAAHELKTPLTLLRAEVELMEVDAALKDILLAHIQHLTRHVQQLLLLAEASEPLSYHFADIDAATSVQDAVLFLQKIAADAHVEMIVMGPAEPATWQADQGALFTLLKNLIENAIQHAPPGSEVRISIISDGVRIRDWGPGVETAQLPLLFTRFWRGAHRRDHGAGLGLAICREIAGAHGWTLSAEQAHPGLAMTVSGIQHR